MLEMADVLPGGHKDFNEAQTVARHVIVSGGVLFGISDEEAAADVLNVERREAVRNFLSLERIAAKVHGLEIGVIDFDASLPEIGDIQEAVSIDFPGRRAFVNRTIGAAVIRIVDDQHGILSPGPAGDGSIFCHENEASGFAGSDQKVGGTAIEDHAGGG